jgi:hypothetical protein
MRSFFRFTLHKRYEGWRWFAHYGGRFDIRFILESIHEIHPQARFYFNVSGSSIINFTVVKTRGGKVRKWHFCDSGRLLPAALARLTNEFNVEHKKLDFAPDSIEYNEHDCRGLYEVLTAFFGRYNICSETIASHAMRVFRTYFLKNKIPSVHEDVEAFVRSAYFGGRCEVYRWDAAELNLFDINSMYPWAMLGLIPVEYRARSLELPDSDEQGIGFYEADIEYPDTYAPCLPWYFGKLYFPVGPMTVRASSMELRQAVMDGCAVRIRRGCVFNCDHVFTDYVNEIYAMKQLADESGDAATRYIAKLLLNSLYGKFGQRRDQVAFALDPGTCFLYGEEGPRVWPMPNNPDICFYNTASTSAHILPHISATITARSRLQILKFIREAGEVWYTDTDSIFTPHTIPVSPELGEMSLDGSGRFQAHGVKEYVFETAKEKKISLKGVPLTVTDPKTGKKTTDFTLAEKYFRGEAVSYPKMPGIMQSIRAGQTSLRYIDQVRKKGKTVPKRARDGQYNTRAWKVQEIIDLTVCHGRKEGLP